MFENHQTSMATDKNYGQIRSCYADPSIKGITTDDRHMRLVGRLAFLASLISPCLVVGTACYIGQWPAALIAAPYALLLGMVTYTSDRAFIYEALATGGIPEVKSDRTVHLRIFFRGIPPFAISLGCIIAISMAFFGSDIDYRFAQSNAPILAKAAAVANAKLDESDKMLIEYRDSLKAQYDKAIALVSSRISDDDKAQSIKLASDMAYTKASQLHKCEIAGIDSNDDESCRTISGQTTSGLKGNWERAKKRQAIADNAKRSADSADAQEKEADTHLESARNSLKDLEQKLTTANADVKKANDSRPERLEIQMKVMPEVANIIKNKPGQADRFLQLLSILATPSLFLSAAILKAGVVFAEIIPLIVAARLPSTTIYGAKRTERQVKEIGDAAGGLAEGQEKIFAAYDQTSRARQTTAARRYAQRRFQSELRRQSQGPSNYTARGYNER